MTEQRVATLIVEVEGRKTNLEQLLKRVHADLLKTRTEAEKTSQSNDKLGASQQRAANSALQQARAQASLLTSQGKLESAFNRLSAALQGVDRSSLAAIRAETQLAQISRKLATEANGSSSVIAKIGPQVLQMAGAFGVATSAVGLAVGAFSAAQSGFNLVATLDASERSLGVFLGSQERANQAFDAGAAFAERYKIKQSEIAGTLQSLAPLLRSSTTETEKQLEVIARLQSLNTRETFEGAAFAVKELASGDYVSIVERFNLSRAAAKELRDEVNSGVDVFTALDAQLNAMGATAAVLEQRTQGAAGAQAAYAKACEDLQIALGELVTGPGTALLNFFAQAARDANEFIQLVGGAQGEQLAAGIFASATSYEAYTAAVQASNAAQRELVAQRDPLGALFGLYPQVQQLTQAQYVYAQSLIATGVATKEAEQRALEFGANVGAIATNADPAIAGLGQRLLALAQQGGTAEEAAFNLALAFNDNGLSAEGLAGQITVVEGQLAANAAATAEAAAQSQVYTAAQQEAMAQSEAYASAIGVENEALSQNLAQKLEGEIQTQRLAEAQGFLASLGSQVASGLLTAGNAAAQLAARYGLASDEALRLINLQATLARSAAVAEAGFSGVPEAYLGAAIGGRAQQPGGVTNSLLSQLAKEGDEAAKRYQARMAEIARADAKLGKGGGAGGGKPKGGKSEADKERERELAAERKFQEQRLQDQEKIAAEIEDAEREHRDTLLDIQKEFEEESLELQRKGEIDKRKTKESFYEALINSDLDAGQQQGLSAQFEEANRRAEELAQQGKQQQAQAYRELKAEQLKAELEYLEAVKKARDEGDTDQLAKLEAIAALRRDREQAELNDLEQRGDEPTNQRDQALAEESQRYADAQGEIGLAAEQAAQRKVEATAKSTEALALETAQIKAQADALAALNAQRGTAGLTTPTATPAAATAAPAAAAPTADPAAALATGTGGPVQVTDPALAETNRRLADVERALRALAQIRNISPGS